MELVPPTDVEGAFQPFGLSHLIVIFLTAVLPFALAAFARRAPWPQTEQWISRTLAATLVVNYLGYQIYLVMARGLSWEQFLPFHLCDWAMVVIVVALLTGWERWLEVAYFWGIGGTTQAILTPDLKFPFPHIRFVSFFVAHSIIVIGIVFMMIMHRYRPHFPSVWRTFAWSEVYFVAAITVDLLTGMNYGYLLHKPESASLLSLLSDYWPVYLCQMHLLALSFFLMLYSPFAIYDLVRAKGNRACLAHDETIST